jgi:mannose-1-phosphate guanylyltransferase
MNLMLLAAGEGTRLRPFTLEKPKPRIPFFSVPLVFYSLSLFDEIEIDQLVVNTYHLPDHIRQVFQLIPEEWRQLHLLHEESGLLGSGGGIHNAKKFLMKDENFFVCNADEVILPHKYGLIQEMQQFHDWHGGIATLLTIDHPEVGHKFGGAWTREDSTAVKCFSKTKPENCDFLGHHFIGVMLLNKKVFKYFNQNVVPENILYETLTEAIKHNEEVHVFKTKAEWFETGNEKDFLAATEHCLNQLLSANSNEAPYWQEFLKQTIRVYSKNELFIEKNWSRVEELKTTILKVKKGAL